MKTSILSKNVRITSLTYNVDTSVSGNHKIEVAVNASVSQKNDSKLSIMVHADAHSIDSTAYKLVLDMIIELTIDQSPENLDDYMKKECIPIANDELKSRLKDLTMLMGYPPLEI